MNDDQLLRYARHIMLPDIDIAGQEKLLAARVLIIGLGGLGSPVALYLAASGVGSLTLADFDSVDLSNLQRQIIHTTASIGEPKTVSPKRKIHEVNPDIEVRLIQERMSLETLEDEVTLADIVVDCTDNFEVRFAINDACLRQQTTLVSGAAVLRGVRTPARRAGAVAGRIRPEPRTSAARHGPASRRAGEQPHGGRGKTLRRSRPKLAT